MEEEKEKDKVPTFWLMKPEVVEYRSEWAEMFEREKALLSSTFSDENRDKNELHLSHIEHFGSTSVPGMVAKPIIDIQGVANPMPVSETAIAKLKELGYVVRPTEGTDPSQYIRFDKGDPIVTHCLHLKTERGKYQIAFREYLRTHPEDVERYSNAKKDILTGKEGVTMKEYRQQKQAVLDEIDARVTKWQSEHPEYA